MQAKGRALYNLIRMNWEEDQTLSVLPWQVEDFRSLPMESFFERLKNVGISLNEEHFKEYGEKSSSPEELTEMLWVNEDVEGFDEAYLCVFELWRRLLPEKQSLSIFCDQLDHLINLYDLGHLDNEELLQEALTDLERILEENSDQGREESQIFDEVALFCAHDLESFIYDYASDLIDAEEVVTASEVVDGFYSYISDKKWFDFIHVRLITDTDPSEAKNLLSRLLEELREEPDFELLLEIARFLVRQGAAAPYIQVMRQARDLIETEQDFQELLANSCEFYRLLDRDAETNAVAKMLKTRQGKSLEQEVSPKDETLQNYYQLLEDFDWSEV